MHFSRIVGVWLVTLCMESIHGIVRSLFLVPRIGEFRSNQIGVLTGSFLIVLVAYLLFGWMRVRSDKDLLRVGLIWLILTVAFELGFGHYVFGRSWESLLADYNLARGGLMPLGLLVLTLAPLITGRVRGSKSGGAEET